jgi:AraC-like DNA-binding protein
MNKSTLQKRPEQLNELFVELIDQHLDDLIKGKVGDMFEIENFASLLFIHPTHLSNTIKETTGNSPCGVYQMKIMEVALKLLSDPTKSIHEIALSLTFDPSQFTKWFKRFNGITPKQYRKQLSGVF